MCALVAEATRAWTEDQPPHANGWSTLAPIVHIGAVYLFLFVFLDHGPDARSTMWAGVKPGNRLKGASDPFVRRIHWRAGKCPVGIHFQQ